MTAHVPGVCECMTCGYPCLRPEGHAPWCPAAAMTSPSHGPAAVVEGEAIGVAGPRDTGMVGEVRPNVGSSASGRPATPTTNKRATARTVTLQNNAG